MGNAMTEAELTKERVRITILVPTDKACPGCFGAGQCTYLDADFRAFTTVCSSCEGTGKREDEKIITLEELAKMLVEAVTK